MNIFDIVHLARDLGASDIHLTDNSNAVFRISGVLTEQDIFIDNLHALLSMIMDSKQEKMIEDKIDIDFAFADEMGQRQRVNVFYSVDHISCTIRLLNNFIPSFDALGLPTVLNKLIKEKRGLILVTGPTGSGKSTTLASMIQEINTIRNEHIITIEDPIEYVYPKGSSLVHQREVGKDVSSFASALRSSLREDPDIILVGEMRDYETISAALTAAETGHLVLSTLHTTGAASTIDRIIDACPGEIQHQVKAQLTGVLKAVITQSLLPCVSGGRVVATEVMLGSDAILNLIREGKIHQIPANMQASKNKGMHTMNMDLIRLLNENRITRETAYNYTNDPKDLADYLGDVI